MSPSPSSQLAVVAAVSLLSFGGTGVSQPAPDKFAGQGLSGSPEISQAQLRLPDNSDIYKKLGAVELLLKEIGSAVPAVKAAEWQGVRASVVRKVDQLEQKLVRGEPISGEERRYILSDLDATCQLLTFLAKTEWRSPSEPRGSMGESLSPSTSEPPPRSLMPTYPPGPFSSPSLPMVGVYSLEDFAALQAAARAYLALQQQSGGQRAIQGTTGLSSLQDTITSGMLEVLQAKNPQDLSSRLAPEYVLRILRELSSTGQRSVRDSLRESLRDFQREREKLRRR